LRDGSTITITYGAHGNPLETDTTSAAGTIRSLLDLDGRPVGYADVWGAATLTGYDTADDVTAVVGSNGSTGYTVDPAGLVRSMSWNGKVVAVPSYSAGGDMISVSYPAADSTHGGNGTQVTLTTDSAGQASAVSASGPGGALIMSDAVTRSQDGRVLTDSVDGATSPTFAYTYDDAGRLVTAEEPNQTVNYGFGATTGCGTGSGVLSDPGANSDRTAETITPTTGTPTTYRYCYGTGDQLLSSTDPSVGTISYNAHGDTMSEVKKWLALPIDS
jgi:YD repeat-containing protein